MDKTKEVISILKFLNELGSLKCHIVNNIKQQPWFFYLDNIPENSPEIQLHFRDRINEEEEDISEEEEDISPVILSVYNPAFSSCPTPKCNFLDWLANDWNQFDKEPKFIKKRYKKNIKTGAPLKDDKGEILYEFFQDDSSRVESFQVWLEKWREWAKEQGRIRSVRKFFRTLYNLNMELKKDNETIELMVGNGILMSRTNSVCHPILAKRINIKFDTEKNIIELIDTDRDSELYTMLLSNIDEVNHTIVQELQKDLEAQNYHPLDRVETFNFLERAIHSLTPDGRMLRFDEKYTPSKNDKLVLQIRPLFFLRKKVEGLTQFVNTTVQAIETTKYIPNTLLNIAGAGISEPIESNGEVTLEQSLAEVGGEDVDILLAKPANKEQLEIARQIEHHDAVLVQGPPGTGKTHTIANLMGHFLAKGDRVLVTSYTPKALRVLQDKLPEDMRSLCVSVLNDSNKEMEQSIDGITEYLSRHNSSELKRKADAAQRERIEIIQRLKETRKKIYQIKFKEYKPLVYNGESISPAEAARFVYAHIEDLSYIPGEIKTGAPLPLEFDELAQLYHTNSLVTIEEETELEKNLPNPNDLILPSNFEQMMTLSKKIKKDIEDISCELDMKYELRENSIVLTTPDSYEITLKKTDKNSIDTLNDYINQLGHFDDWSVGIVANGAYNDSIRASWEKLCNSVTDLSDFSNKKIGTLLGKTIQINSEQSRFELSNILEKIQNFYVTDGKIPWLQKFLHKEYLKTCDNITINDKPISSADDCKIVLDYLNLLEKRNACAILWDNLFQESSVPKFETLDNGRMPERIARNLIPKIRYWLDWHQNEFQKIKKLMQSAGINPEMIFVRDDFDDEITIIKKIFTTIFNILPLLLQLQGLYIEYLLVKEKIIQADTKMKRLKENTSHTCKKIGDAWSNRDTETYKQLYIQLGTLYDKYATEHMRQNYLERLFEVAPTWANAIRDRVGVFGMDQVNENIKDAWRWKQYNQMLSELMAMPFDQLQKANLELSRRYRKATCKLAEFKAWYHLLQRIEMNMRMKQDLQGWKLVTKKIGHGTGKRAPIYRAQAKQLMGQCQEAVPAWIMTIPSVINNLVPGKNLFDVMIVDEASQADITALPILYMAKKIIIVGDDKQVSPMGVGVDLGRVDALADMYIKDRVPNWSLYTSNTSLYDIAATICQPLMLHEHFRCVPEIIGFCNHLCYDGKIKPLRDTSDCKLQPAIIPYRVDGSRDEGRKENLTEASKIVNLIRAMIEQPEYSDKTFGVISLLGNEQAKLINTELLKHLDIESIEKHDILCGDASQFQGDERDVILLSMVDSNENDTPLTLYQPTTRDANKRYNVAVSRAKDQLWIIHSLDVSKDLKENDIRKLLLDYADNPHCFDFKYQEIERNSESPFEESVAKSLVDKGYNLVQQWPVGHYRIDMVVICNNDRVALECDGERYHSGAEKIREDMERQTILERLGWRFIRLRGSEYYSNPEKAMQHVVDDLNQLGIYPEYETENCIHETGLLQRVKVKCWQIEQNDQKEKEEDDENQIF
ncbi:AAA domain-containing protein [uncultured Megasphaera sp.]|uniref:AAA domain-containing protein n=1 Tax=uncultured Megasphaera sp. TaxID=165188 RepID=UPI0026163B57|nr:AAA domain-containing protein [uncultured Megasphaera sp.]